MRKMKCVLLCGILVGCLFGSYPAMAAESHDTIQNSMEKATLYVELYNPVTGERIEQQIDTDELKIDEMNISGNLLESECEIIAYIPDDSVTTNEKKLPVSASNDIAAYGLDVGDVERAKIEIVTDHNKDSVQSDIATCDTKTKTKADPSGSVSASLKLTYTANNTSGYYANITKVSGSWTKSDRSVSMSSRQVDIYRPVGKVATYYPTSNTFSYNVTWGGSKWMAGAMVFGSTSKVKLTRGTGNPWYLTLQCILNEDDFE